MKKLKKVNFLLIAIIMVIQIVLPTITYAASEIFNTDTKSLNIKAERPYEDEGKTYKVQLDGLYQTIFKIGEQNGTEITFPKTMYCLRSGLGFGSTDEILPNGTNYTYFANLKKESTKVKNYYNTTLRYNISNENYNALCWLVDNMYLPENEDAANLKANFLQAVGATNIAALKENDIDAIQQMAIWYFTNYDTNGQSSSMSLERGTDLALYLRDETDNNNYFLNRFSAINGLYTKTINTALDNAEAYGTNEARKITKVVPQIALDKVIKNNIIKKQVSENEYLVAGPFKINNTANSNVDYSLNGKLGYIANASAWTNLTIDNTNIFYSDANANKLDRVTSAKDLVNEGDFYIAIPSNLAQEMSRVKFEIEYNYSYTDTVAEVWLAEQEDQPVLVIDKKENSQEGADFVTAEVATTEIEGTKTWEDYDNLYGTRPLNIKIGLYTKDDQGNLHFVKEQTIQDDNDANRNIWSYTFTDLPIWDENGNAINYVVRELTSNSTLIEQNGKNGEYEVIYNGNNITNKYKEVDLALRKYITAVNDRALTNDRTPVIDIEKLAAEEKTTAEYNHRKDPVEIETGDIVTYNLTIYNEGDLAGRATKVVDQLPTGLKFLSVLSGNYELESYNEETNRLTLKEKTGNGDLEPFDGTNLESTTIQIKCEVTATVGTTDKILTNVAWISQDCNAETQELRDRDSEPETVPNVNKDNMSDYTGKDSNKEDLTDSIYHYEGKQDDDDFEKLILKTEEFDLALRKYISSVNGEELIGKDSRVPSVDTTGLVQGTSTTAKYTHPKTPITVKQGDIVTYTIRVYNEGDLDGMTTKVSDYLPEWLGYLMNYNLNTDNLWHVNENAETMPLVSEEDGLYKTEGAVKHLNVEDFNNTETLSDVQILKGEAEIYTTILNNSVIKAYGTETEEGDIYQATTNNDKIFYRDVQVACIVLAPNTYPDYITNKAEIDEDKALDEQGNKVEIPDRDSTPSNIDLEDYELREENSTYQEDDDDYESVQLKYFDLALRKFITKIGEEDITTRIPEVTFNEDGKIEYVHDKTPLEVSNSDIVTYTIRVYNEGSIAGYAEEIEDDIPEGLVFLPENDTNKDYKWKMYYRDEDNNLVETNKVEEATVIRTEYLSEANGILKTITDETTGEETQENSNLLKEFESTTMEIPDYRDIKVTFEVKDSNIPKDNEDRIITNKAHITEDSDYDEDSIPDEWNEGEDDQDKEHIYVRKFDLALFKWVTKSIVTVDGKTTTTETNFKPNVGKTSQTGEEYRDNEEPEPIAQVVLDKKKLNKTTVKFVYNIKVVNEGEIEGYATEIADYIPAGLKFVPEDNPLWSLLENENRITTRALETKLLKPGESATLEVVFTWINDKENLGVKTNIAAITEDYNERDAEDIDSTPGNENIPEYNKEQEDDDDFALVILTLKTGNAKTYFGIVITVLAIISLGVVSIKKFVL